MLQAQPGVFGQQILDIRLWSEKDEHHILLEAPSGETQKGVLRLSINPAEVARAISTATQLTENTTRRGGSYDMQDPLRDLGVTLFAAMFTGRRESLYRRTMSSGRDYGARVVIRIRSAEPQLSGIPWEFMHDGQDFVGLSSWSSIIHQPSNQIDSPSLATLENIRMLVMVSDITGQMQADEEVNRIQSISKRYPQLDITYAKGVTRQDFLNILDDEPYHILHFIGTGVEMSNGEQALALMTDPGQEAQMQATAKGSGNTVAFDFLQLRALRMALEKFQPDMRLVVMSACKTDGLAAGLADVAVATIGMRGDISTSACIVFTAALYRGMVTGQTVEESIALARQEIDNRLTGSREWGLPVAYLHQLEGAMWASVAALYTSDVITGSDEMEAEPSLSEENMDAWKKFDILMRVYQMNLHALKEQEEAYSENVPVYLATQVSETEERLERARTQQRQLSGETAQAA